MNASRDDTARAPEPKVLVCSRRSLLKEKPAQREACSRRSDAANSDAPEGLEKRVRKL
jgi:hypothetical protein